MPRAKASRTPAGPQTLQRCRGCGAELRTSAETRWECECGVAVCREDACFDEYFKLAADGESTRCRTCGSLV